MRAVVLYIATSLDGFIAGPNHELDWLPEPQAGEDFGYSAFLETIDTTLMGGTTFDVVQRLSTGNPYPEKTNLVFTRQQRAPFDGITWVHENPVEIVQQLKNQPGKDIWLVGGGNLNTQLLNAGLIDVIRLFTFPVVLGKGIPLFADGAAKRNFTLSSVNILGNLGTAAVYTKV
jgi:dihydrofolate reductase